MREIMFPPPGSPELNNTSKPDQNNGHFREDGSWSNEEKKPRQIIFEPKYEGDKEKSAEKIQEKPEVANAEKSLSQEKQGLLVMANRLKALEGIKKTKFELGLEFTGEEKAEYDQLKAQIEDAIRNRAA